MRGSWLLNNSCFIIHNVSRQSDAISDKIRVFVSMTTKAVNLGPCVDFNNVITSNAAPPERFPFLGVWSIGVVRFYRRLRPALNQCLLADTRLNHSEESIFGAQLPWCQHFCTGSTKMRALPLLDRLPEVILWLVVNSSLGLYWQTFPKFARVII